MKEKKRKHGRTDHDAEPSSLTITEDETVYKVTDTCEADMEQQQEHQEPGDTNTEEPAEASLKKRKRKKKRQAVHGNNEKVTNAQTESTLSDAEKLNHMDYTIYVDGLPFDCTEEQVEQFFISNGCTDVLQLRLPKYA